MYTDLKQKPERCNFNNDNAAIHIFVKDVAYFQKLMNKVLKDLLFTIAYLNDIIIFSKTAEEYLDHLQHIFHKLHNARLSIKLSKCHMPKKFNIWAISSLQQV